jgi:putative transposase
VGSVVFKHARRVRIRLGVLPQLIEPDNPSPRPMPSKLPALEYLDRFEVRYVSANGGIRWNKQRVNDSSTCIGEYIWLEEIANGIWNVYFGALRLDRFDERSMRVEDAYSRLFRPR